MGNNQLTNEIKNKAIMLGYDLFGVISASTFEDYAYYLNKRIEEFPESIHLYERLKSLSTPSEFGKSIIVCIRRYNKYKIPKELENLIGKVYLFDERLSFSCKKAAEHEFSNYLNEIGINFKKDEVSARWAAKYAELGTFGRNNFIYTEYGSYVWIDTWTVDVDLDYTVRTDIPKFKSLCNDNCRRCIDACPTKALCGDYSMDRGKCIAHLSFNSKELPSDITREKMGMWLYGCDICQDVCPMNKNKWDEQQDFPELYKVVEDFTLEKILEMNDDFFRSKVLPRFGYIDEDRIWLWKCNSLRVMANSGEPKYYDIIRKAVNNKDKHVKEMALWCCKKLKI